jgi:tetratricopeptide (TPR) repeat protein
MKIHEKIHSLYDELGRTALSQGFLPLAEQMFSAAVEEAKRPAHEARVLAGSWFGLAQVYHKQQKIRLALHYYQKAVTFYERNPDDFACQLAAGFDNLASLYLLDGELDKARTYSRKALNVYERLLGPVSPILAPRLVRLGYIYSQWKHFDKALAYYQRAQNVRCQAASSADSRSAGGN